MTTAQLDLTDRQLEVARLIADGKTFTEISEELGTTARNAKYHSDNIRHILGVQHKRQIGSVLRARGLA